MSYSISRLSFTVRYCTFLYKSVNISSHFGGLISPWHDLSILESVAELRVPVGQAALTVHDIDPDSGVGTSVITDDRSSCRFSEYKEVSEYMYITMLQLWVRKVWNCAKADNIWVLRSSKSSSVIPAVYMLNFESVSVAEEIIDIENHGNCLHVQTKLCGHVLSMCTNADSHYVHK